MNINGADLVKERRRWDPANIDKRDEGLYPLWIDQTQRSGLLEEIDVSKVCKSGVK